MLDNIDRRIARFLHESTNATYWMEKPGWKSGNAAADFALEALRRSPMRIHDTQKRMIFKDGDTVTVSGESIVVPYQENYVRKYMFRYPGNMPLQDFYEHTKDEVDTVTRTLSGIALPTMVQKGPADIFRAPFSKVDTVMQTQPRIDLLTNPPLNIDDIEAYPSHAFEQTVRDLHTLLGDIDTLVFDHGLHPDIGPSSGNLRRDVYTGSISLIDVMPLHMHDGGRLIGDSPSKLPRSEEVARHIGEFIGKFGS